MKTRGLIAAFAAMLGAYLCACDPDSDTAVQAAVPRQESGNAGSDFDRAVLAIKAMKATQEEKTSAIDALASRYGHIVAAPRAANPVIPDDGTIEAGPLRKVAGDWSVVRFYPKKGHSFGNDFVLGTPGLLVRPGQTFNSWTARPAGSVADPYTVAFYQTRISGNAFRINVVGLSDDIEGSLDSRISWTNQTGSDQWVFSYAFAYSGSTGGKATLISKVDGGTPQAITDEMHGLVEYGNNKSTPAPADGCTGPNFDRLSLHTVSRGGYTYGIMLVNSETMKGGLIYNDNGIATQTLNLPGPATPSGYPNFMLWFATSQAEGSGTGGDYTGTQYQAYSCPS
jgi:hypothetical protein